MRIFKTFQKTLLVSAGVLALAACTQGENIQSPGASDPGTPPAGGGDNGGGDNGGGTAECPTGFTTGTSVGGLTVCNISGSVLGNLTLPFVSGVAYQLDGRVDVGIDVGADGTTPGGSTGTLTIEPGVQDHNSWRMVQLMRRSFSRVKMTLSVARSMQLI